MNYTFFAIGAYIVMRALRVLFEEYKQTRWYKILMIVIALCVLYAAVASLIVWYKEMPLLGFSPSK